MGRIIFLNRFFYPDCSATSQILSDLAFHLAGAGRDIRGVTSQQHYDDPSARLPCSEEIRGVSIPGAGEMADLVGRDRVAPEGHEHALHSAARSKGLLQIADQVGGVLYSHR